MRKGIKRFKKLGAVALAASISLSCMMPTSFAATTTSGNWFIDNFNEQYEKIKDTDNGYFNSLGMPYHSVETIMCDGPDYGHESTSETASYYVWLEAMKGKFSGDFSGVTKAWDIIEKYYIPTHTDQPAMAAYNASKPATYAAEYESPSSYPSKMNTSAVVGTDPLDSQLKTAYSSSDIYGMHWLVDNDNWYGYGIRGTGTGFPVYINSYQRGPNESSFETVTHPSWEGFKYGGSNGFLDLFVGDNSYTKQYRYTNAPDADARAIQATYDAYLWAKEEGATLDSTLPGKAAKMGDYLRYAMFDKYFRKIGTPAQAGTGYDACDYLLGWYYSWGGDVNGSWAWKIGSSHMHQAYQSPLAGYILSENSDFKPKSSNGATDWASSTDRQIEFYNWLQSEEGAIAAGATNMWNGNHSSVPSDVSTFYGMGYKETPVYEDPKDNRWIGFQAWPMQRVAEYYYYTKDANAKELVTKWADWITSEIVWDDTNKKFTTPMNMSFTGQPDTWTGSKSSNSNLHVVVDTREFDPATASSLANALSYIAAANNDADLQATAKKMLVYISNYKDDLGISVESAVADYSRFNDKIYIPSGWTGKMPNGDVINSDSTFLSIRSNYKKDADWARVEAALNAGEAPTFTYHRFWQQTDIAVAFGTYAILFPDDTTSSLTETLLGDVNSDGSVNAIDFALLKKYLLNSSSVTIDTTNADLNEDGVVNAIDFALLKKKLLSGS